MPNSRQIDTIITLLIEKGEVLLNRPIEPNPFTREAVIDEMRKVLTFLPGISGLPYKIAFALIFTRNYMSNGHSLDTDA